MRMIKILENVATLLQQHRKLRNDDVLLVLNYWKIIDKIKVIDMKNPLAHPLTSPATIIRVRQRLQSEGYLLPTDKKVLIKRQKQKVKMRRWLGYLP